MKHFDPLITCDAEAMLYASVYGATYHKYMLDDTHAYAVRRAADAAYQAVIQMREARGDDIRCTAVSPSGAPCVFPLRHALCGHEKHCSRPWPYTEAEYWD